MRIIIYLLFSCMITFSLAAQNKESISAKQFLEMDIDKVFPLVEKMTKEETDSLITQVRQEARESYKDIDKFHLLISHLESIKAIQEEQKRLKSLHIVYSLALFLFVSIMGYILFSQRKIIKEIQRYSEK